MNGAIPFAKSYFFRRILAFEEATRIGSHAKEKKEIGGEVVGVMVSNSTNVSTGHTTTQTGTTANQQASNVPASSGKRVATKHVASEAT